MISRMMTIDELQLVPTKDIQYLAVCCNKLKKELDIENSHGEGIAPGWRLPAEIAKGISIIRHGMAAQNASLWKS